MAQNYSVQSVFQWKILFATILIMYIYQTWASPVSTNTNKYTQEAASSSPSSASTRSANNLNKLQTTTPINFNDINRDQFTLKPAALNTLIKWVAANTNKKSQPKLSILNNLINITNINYNNTNNNNSKLKNLIELSTESIIKLSLNQVLNKTNISKNFKPNNSNNNNNNNNAITSTTRLRESFVIPSSSDSELEAKILYEKSLKEYDAMEGRSLNEICSIWQMKKCSCTGQLDQITLKCRGLGLVEIPLDTPDKVVYLDLGNNNITHLPSRAFDFVPNLEELILSNNIIKRIDSDAFLGLSKLKRLSLQNCGITVLPEDSFQHIPNLVSLFLSSNTLIDMDKNSLKYFHNLRTLRLEGNAFYRIPTLALAELNSVEILNMGNNLLSIIKKDDFPTLPNLIILILKRNHIHHIESGSFIQLKNMKILDLSDNLLKELPGGLRELTALQELTVTANHIAAINQTDLPKNLLTLDMRANSLIHIDAAAFRRLSRLRKLIMSDVRTLKEFPNLDGCNSLEIIRLDRAGIQEINGSLCKISSNLRSLELKTNDLNRIPDLSNCKSLRLLDLSSNRIESLSGKPFRHLSNLHDLLLSYNQIKSISYDAFSGIGKLQSLDLEGNEIEAIHEEAFAHFEHLEDLNLGQNIFPYLPSTGLEHLVHLKTFNNPKLKDFPNPEIFPRIRTLVLSYAYHCCPFLPLITSAITQKPPLVHEAILFPSNDFDPNFWNSSMADIWPHLNNLTSKLGPQINDILDSFGQDFLYPGNLPTYVEDYFDEDENNVVFQGNANDFIPGSVQCLPLPGPFLPCVDLFDWWTLRCGVWMVFLLALFGNGTVVFVLIFSRSKMDVPRFLVCNLAAADFFMGIYLGILAIVDASTFGHFRMYAIPWQMSIFCQIAGFLAVLSSELSVYTLAVITLERNYAITNAIHLNKRLTLKQATYIMLFGWTFALTMASLPLVGVSDYRKFAICLPFETTTGIASLGYVIALMFINGCAFLTLMGCYLKMYWAIRGSQAWNTNDSRIAKRMALLVFTDFLCWSPIAFFSLTAICGLHLISLEQAKIFTVFILPLNSCCNPFLYAIMTKQFKKDCITLCKSIEETRATKANAVRVNDKRIKELPPLLPNPHIGCRCLRMLPHEMPRWQKFPKKENIIIRLWNRVFCRKKKKVKETKLRRPRRAAYNYQFTDVKASIKKPNRASSISSENFCSSRSSSWRNGAPSTHSCSIPLKVMDPNSRRRHSAWLITRKTSQDSNLSSSRNDSSASATTASTSTFRLSRSSASSATPTPSMNCLAKQNSFGTKPKLVRQQAVVQEEIEITGSESSSPRLGVRFLPTIPSAADSSVIMEDNSNSNSNEEVVPVELYAVLQNTGNPRASLSSPKEPTDKPP